MICTVMLLGGHSYVHYAYTVGLPTHWDNLKKFMLMCVFSETLSMIQIQINIDTCHSDREIVVYEKSYSDLIKHS